MKRSNKIQCYVNINTNWTIAGQFCKNEVDIYYSHCNSHVMKIPITEDFMFTIRIA